MITESLNPFLQWMNTHPHWAGVMTFLISLGESVAVFGLIVPGSVIMTAIGMLIGAGVIPAFSIITWAILGAIAGDGLSYWLGKHFHGHIRDMWPFRKYPQILTKGERFFHKHGGKSVFLGRFIGPVRPIIPLVAGMMNMRPRNFYIANIFSGIAWAPAYMIPGILIGAAAHELAPSTATRFVVLVLAALFVIWMTYYLFKLLLVKIVKFLDRKLDDLWDYCRKHRALSPICKLLHDPKHPHRHGQMTMAFACLATFIAFIILAINVVQHGALTSLNQPVYYFLRSLRHEWLDKTMIFVTFLGQKQIMLVMAGVVALWFASRRHWRAFFHWVVLCGAITVSVEFFKHLIHSARPSGIVAQATSYSFPSGHVSLTVALYGFLAILIAREYRGEIRRIIYLVAIIPMVLVLFSRLYLGAHWLTDVIGSLLLASSIVMALTISYRRIQAKNINPKLTALVAVLSLALTFTLYSFFNYKDSVKAYTPVWQQQTINVENWWNNSTNAAIPLYRKNRFGSPVQLLNVQWAGDKLQITKRLTQQGWQEKPKHDWLSTINRIAGNHKKPQLPIIENVFQEKKPALILYKMIEKRNILIILRLWDGHITLSNEQKLWLGTISYRTVAHINPFRQKERQKILADTPDPTVYLEQDLAKSQWKQIEVSPTKRMLNNGRENTIILLVK